ncbi:MAG: hypothetical protein ACJ763_05240 [Bdellovibrionia bacterium]
MKKNQFASAAVFGIALGGGAPGAGSNTEVEPGVSRRQFQKANAKIGEWLHLRMPDPQGGPGKELFVNLAKRVTFVCPGSSTGLWRSKARSQLK